MTETRNSSAETSAVKALPDGSRRTVAILEILAAACIGTVLAAAYAGPLRADVASISLSVRTLTRPAIAACVFIGLRAWMAVVRPDFRPDVLAGIAARITAGAVVAASAIGWTVYLSPTIGGADSYGYVAASERILAGSLIQPEPLAPLLPFPSGISAATPLGFAPSPKVPNASVPIYPLGLPLLMAAASAVSGPMGPFAVSVLMGAVLVAASYRIAWVWFRDRDVALIAAALVAAHPLVFTYSIQPMSDVPAAAFMLLAIAFLSASPTRPIAAGCSAAMALFIRPALAPAAALLVVSTWFIDPRRAWRLTVRAAVPLALGVGLQALSQLYLYGDARASGHGPVAGLFSIDRLVANSRSYMYWAIAMTGLTVIAGFAVGLVTSERGVRIRLALVAIGVVVPYLFYLSYDHWETLRFFLPVLLLTTIVAAAGLVWVGRRLAGRDAGALVAAVLVVAIAWGWLQWLQAYGVFDMPERERRHQLAAELVTVATPPDAVIMALQHSGSLRYYAHRDTINWDQVPAGGLAATVKAVRGTGRRVFVMTDSDEERAQFRARHGSIIEDAGWLPAGQRRDVQLYEAREARSDPAPR